MTLYDKKRERLHTTYVAASPEYGKETFFERLEREILREKEHYPNAETIGIADGASDNWPFLEKHTSKKILDFWHVTEYLSAASLAVFPPKSLAAEREQWLEQSCHDLKHKKGAATRILNQLKECTEKRLSQEVKEKLSAAMTYFKNNIKAGRVKYYQHTEKNLPIGSGVIEAACKTIIKQRLGATGVRWKEMILSLRSLVKTPGRWHQFWEKINISGVPALL